MAKTETTVKSYFYTVTSPNGGTVTDASGKLNKTVEAGDQVTVQAPSDSLTCDDDDAVIYKANFKSPLLALRLLGQGANALPTGYTRVEFLEGSGKQYIITDYYQSTSAGAEISADCELLGSGNVTISACGLVPTDNGSPWGFGLYSSGGKANFSPFSNKNLYYGSIQVLNKRCLFKLKANSLWIDGVEDTRNFYGTWSSSQVWYTARPLTLFGTPKPDEGWAPEGHVIKAYRFTASVSGKVERDFIPVLDPTGTPCMFDRVSKQPFRNSGSGSFIAGVGTVAQLTALLRKLPASGGKLTLSLPAEANTPEVAEQLQACHDTKGWTLTVHEYRPSATATYSLRRVREVVWCRREQSDLGSYVDADGFRWQIDRCAAIFGALGQDPAAYCYTPFDSVEEAVEFWEMQPYVDPEAMDENMGDNGTLEQGGTENTSPTTNS